MADNSEMIRLYSQKILALAAQIPHCDRLNEPQASATKRSPLCGSNVTVDVSMTDDVVTGFGQDVKACALGQASASILGAAVIGRTKGEIIRGRDELKTMLKFNGPVPAAPFDGLSVLQPASAFKNRHASILLAFDATLEAIQEIEAQ